MEFGGEFKKFAAPERAARLVCWMIAPDAQRHTIACVGQRKLAVRLLFPRQFWRRALDLHMHARLRRSFLRCPANFGERQQLHVDLRQFGPATTKAIEEINRRG